MKFNIAYSGPEHLFHLRRDFILVLKYTLEDLGHDVILSGTSVDAGRFNLLIGGYFLAKEALEKMHVAGVRFAHVNTEVIGNDMLNFNPEKTDFMGSYLPSMQRGEFVWDVIMDNMEEHRRYGTNAHFLRWGWHPKMQDIQHRAEKDLDFYFFGALTDRRRLIINKLGKAGIAGAVDHSCPYFLRNDRIARAKVQLNLVQDDKYTHVNSFRICYLANNACCILSEHEQDPADYLRYAETLHADELLDRVRHYLVKGRWKQRGEEALEQFREHNMNELTERLLDASFPTAGR